ncbi:uncharacterized protein [Typha latifolia]|uniref:uncharacterized protein isoform X1 n=1 Tax=Typha latifolia TaxID=4733 RepID=UPI003C2B6642
MAVKRKADVPMAGDQPPPARELDFRAPQDDAWYGVRLHAERDGVLRVMYREFSEEFDERYVKEQFKDMNELEEFKSRFRPSSIQLQDSECWKVVKGVKVCAAYAGGDDDVRFYDAVVETVRFSQHKFFGGEGSCTCKFLVLWQHGSHAGEKTAVGIEHICLIKSSSLQDPILNDFLDYVRKLLEARICRMDQTVSYFSEISGQNVGTSMHQKVSPSTVSRSCNELERSRDDCSLKKPLHFRYNFEETRLPKWTTGLGSKSRGKTFKRWVCKENNDFGGQLAQTDSHKMSYFSFWIENLENDLLPSTIMEFVHREVSISSQVTLYPGLLQDAYCKAAIFMESKEQADQLFDFLFDPGHIIVSSKGSPWVTSEKWCGEIEGLMPRYEMQQPIETKGQLNEIKLVPVGSEEYQQAKEVQDLHRQFHNYVQCQQKKLAQEDKKLRGL